MRPYRIPKRAVLEYRGRLTFEERTTLVELWRVPNNWADGGRLYLKVDNPTWDEPGAFSFNGKRIVEGEQTIANLLLDDEVTVETEHTGTYVQSCLSVSTM